MLTFDCSTPLHATGVEPRKNNENPYDYTSRIFVTELLRPAHEIEKASLQRIHEQRITELRGIIGSFSQKQKASLLQKYSDMATAQVRDLTGRLLREKKMNFYIGWTLILILPTLFLVWLKDVLMAAYS